jgi:hypothetical protein
MHRIGYRNTTRGWGMAVLAAAVTWTSALAAVAQAQARTVTLDSGTVIPVQLNETLSSADSQKGDRFTATVRPPSDNNNSAYADYSALPVGTKIEGIVNVARPMNGKDPGVLDLQFRRVRLPDGRSYPIEGSLIGLDNKSVTRTADGRLVAKPNHKHDRLTYVGYGAGAGLLVGLLTKHTLEDTLIGGGLGYLFGSLQKSHSDARDVVLKPGTELGVRLDRRLTYSNDTSSSGYRNGDNYAPGDSSYHRGSQSGNALDRSANIPDNGTNIGVLIGDQNVAFPSTAGPIQTNNTVLVPAAHVLKAAHVPYQYDGKRKEIRAEGPNGIVRLSVGSAIAVVNGSQRVRMETDARLLNGTLYVPLRFLHLATGDNVDWDSSSRTVVLTSSEK